MRLVRFAAVQAGATIPFKRLSIQDVIPTRRALVRLHHTGDHLMPAPVDSSANPQATGTPSRRARGPAPALSLAYPDACGIDIGSTSHFVAVPADRDDAPVREFRAFTADLHSLIDWLRQCRVTAVAMESTGVYWIALYEMLDAAGFKVQLVNAWHVKTVPGRKSDVLDCQWLQQLMSAPGRRHTSSAPRGDAGKWQSHISLRASAAARGLPSC